MSTPVKRELFPKDEASATPPSPAKLDPYMQMCSDAPSSPTVAGTAPPDADHEMMVARHDRWSSWQMEVCYGSACSTTLHHPICTLMFCCPNQVGVSVCAVCMIECGLSALEHAHKHL